MMEFSKYRVLVETLLTVDISITPSQLLTALGDNNHSALLSHLQTLNSCGEIPGAGEYLD